jgi:hypothetical protein
VCQRTRWRQALERHRDRDDLCRVDRHGELPLVALALENDRGLLRLRIDEDAEDLDFLGARDRWRRLLGAIAGDRATGDREAQEQGPYDAYAGHHAEPLV